MPTNNQTDESISTEGEALAFWAPGQQPRRHSSRVQIIDVFSLQVATGYSRDPQGRLLLEAQTSVAAGRSWTLAKAAQLIRIDAPRTAGWHCRWTSAPGASAAGMPPRGTVGGDPWKLVAWTSLAWLTVLGITVDGFLAVLERQDRKLELLLQRTATAEFVRPWLLAVGALLPWSATGQTRTAMELLIGDGDTVRVKQARGADRAVA